MIEVDGARLAYDEAGRGPAVVFSHAGIADRRMWEHQFRALAAHHRVVRYDWRGYGDSGDSGESGESGGAHGPFAHYADLLAVLDALDIEQATLVGCSMGGAYAVEAALAAPQRVSALALVASGLGGWQWPPQMLAAVRERVHSAVPADRLARYRAGTAREVSPRDVAAMARAQARFLVAGPDREPSALEPAVWDTAVEMLYGVFDRQWSAPPQQELSLDPPASGRLSEITVPTLVVNGLADAPWIQDVSDVLCSGIPHAERLDLPDTGHLPPLERPGEVTAALSGLLAGVRSAHGLRPVQ